MSDTKLSDAVKARSVGFGNFIDPARKLADFPHLSLVEVDVPAYERNGLGRALLKVVRYEFTDIETFGVEGMSVAADSSGGYVVYEDMNPVLVGRNYAEAQASCADQSIVRELYARKLPMELVTLGALRASQFTNIDELVSFIAMYRARASWMELHPVQVRFADIEAQTGSPAVFDWDRLLMDSKGN